MNMRVTTKALISGYSRNLNNSISNLNSAREKVLTKRNFNKMSEDPGAATKAFQLRREYAMNNDYIDNVETIQSTYDSMTSSIDQINKALQNINSEVLAGLNGATSQEGRETYAKSIEENMNAIVLSVNATFGGKFIFGGQNTANVPFELKDGKLYYNNGVKPDGTPDMLDVNSTDPAVQKKLKALSNESVLIDIGIGLKMNNGSIISDSAFDTAYSGLKILGFGNVTTPTVKNQNLSFAAASNLTANDFDTINKSLNEINRLNSAIDNGDTSADTQTKLNDQLDILRGFPSITVTSSTHITMTSPVAGDADLKLIQGNTVGEFGVASTDASGNVSVGFTETTAVDGTTSQNIVTLMGQMATALRDPNFKDDESFRALTDQFKKNFDNVVDNLTQMGVKSAYLTTTKKRLEDNSDALTEKIVSLENVDMAEAISNYSWEQYAYNAALKVGTSILSPSFIDFMK